MAFTDWLNTFFASYDKAILEFLHSLAVSAGGVLTPVAKAFTLLGEEGIIMFALAFILALFPKTRREGVCIFGAVCCGALITNIILKDIVARPRPYEVNELYMSFRELVGNSAEDGFSFPSGHATAATAGATAIALSFKKWWAYLPFIFTFCVAVSRNYLIAHYPSDVLFGIVIGAVSAVIAYFIAKAIFDAFGKHDKYLFSAFVNKFDIRHPTAWLN